MLSDNSREVDNWQVMLTGGVRTTGKIVVVPSVNQILPRFILNFK